MRIESPVLEFSSECEAWIDAEENEWLCGEAVQQFWDVSEAPGNHIVLIASDKPVHGAQKVRVVPSRLFDDNVAANLSGSDMYRGVYWTFSRHLQQVAKRFGTHQFYGWIEIVQ